LNIDLKFDRRPRYVAVSEDGKLVRRIGYPNWRGVLATEALPSQRRASWRLVLSPNTDPVFNADEQKFFVGMAREGTPTDSDSSDGWPRNHQPAPRRFADVHVRPRAWAAPLHFRPLWSAKRRRNLGERPVRVPIGRRRGWRHRHSHVAPCGAAAMEPFRLDDAWVLLGRSFPLLRYPRRRDRVMCLRAQITAVQHSHGTSLVGVCGLSVLAQPPFWRVVCVMMEGKRRFQAWR